MSFVSERLSAHASRAALVLVLFGLFAPLPAVAQTSTPVAGQNINMVSGTQWPGGDPFLQRQNEPSIAVSSRNSLHLLAGANDYRTVDLPVSDVVPGSLAGDAWLGVFKSFDGGQTWWSTLHPGYPQDNSPEGLASPLKAYSAAADPTVRAGTNGLFYYSGIAFNRGTNVGAVFVSTFLDANQKENGDPTQGKDTIKRVSTVLVDTGNSGQFLDKTWIAVDIPRAGAASCTFNPLGTPQSFPAGNVYLVWSRFTGSTSTKIMFSRSLDCGKTWSTPIKLSESNSINQGTNLAIDPKNGDVYAVWRRFASSSQTDALIVAKSTDLGKTFPSKNTVQIAPITPFDQSTTSTSFRTSTLPSIAVSVDSNGVSRPHVAWAQRDLLTGDAKIVVSTSNDGGATWGSPVAVDAVPLTDNPPAPPPNSFSRGHQFMPQLTFAAGRLMVLYYDQRLDHTLGFSFPYNPFAPDAQGNFYKVLQKWEGDGPGLVFPIGLSSTVDDAKLTARRHTIDLRVAEAFPGATLAFTSASVSQYRIGLRAPDDRAPDDPDALESLEQLQDSPPNLPMFAQGTGPFLGDYIDLAGQTFVTQANGSYAFNTSRSSPPTFYATWTDNRDVKPPLDGNWGHYTPVGGGGPSVLDPSQPSPPCVNGQEGMRNQNIYSSLVTDGLLVGSPQNAKPLSPTLQRAFIATIQNFTTQARTFRMTIANQPAGGQASFLQGSFLTQLDVSIDAHSGAARPVFVTSTNPAASVTVNVNEIGPGSIGLSGFLVLNPEGTVSPLAQPDGTTADIGSLEVYTPSFAVWNTVNATYVNITDPNQNISNQNISNQNISNADPAIQNISNQNISNQNISNQNISNVDPAIQNISNQNISNATYADQNISNQNISNQNISNATITDATYAVTNSGNTTHSYRLALYGSNTDIPLQLIVTKNSSTPTSVNCTLVSLPQTVVASSVESPVIASSLSAATSAALLDSSLSNGTVSIAPGETVFLTLRGLATPNQMSQLVQQLTPVVTAHGATAGVNAFAALLFIQAGNGGALSAAIVGSPYSATLQAAGGTGPLTWIVQSGALPGGLSLSTSGVLSGTPTGSGSFAFTVKVSDSSPVPQSATQSFQLTVNARASTTFVTVSPSPVAAGQPATVSVTVTDVEASGTKSSPTGSVSLSSTIPTDSFSPAASCTLTAGAVGSSSCSATVSGTVLGPRTISAAYAESSVHPVHSASGSMAALTVEGNTTTTITSDAPAPSLLGAAVTVSFTVAAVSPASGTPTGTVTVTDGLGASCSAALVSGSGSCSLVPAGSGTVTLTATYPGDATFFGSSGTRQHVVQVFYSFAGFFSPLTTAGSISTPSNSGSGNFTKGLPIKWQLKDSAGNFITDLTSTQKLQATYYAGGVCTAGQATGQTFVLYLPTSGAAGGSTFRYDSSSNQFLFNWSTKSVTTGPGCYEIILQLSDGSAAKATKINLQ